MPPNGRILFGAIRTSYSRPDTLGASLPSTGKAINIMAKKARKKGKKKATRKKAGKKKGGDLIISKARTKAAASLNVSSDFYGALDVKVRACIAAAEGRANANKRKTLRPQDL
jgi:hypothetical protein